MDQKIFYKNHPFAFLLMICDKLQDWGRASQKRNKDTLKIVDMSIGGSNGTPMVSIKIDASDDRIEKLKQKLSSELLITDGKIIIQIITPNELPILQL
jgi:hypothetical protein